MSPGDQVVGKIYRTKATEGWETSEGGNAVVTEGKSNEVLIEKRQLSQLAVIPAEVSSLFLGKSVLSHYTI